MTRFVFMFVLAFEVAKPLSHERNVFEERIVGGYPAPEGKYPHQVSLRKHNIHFCGGSIISSRWVLSACHCTYGEEVTFLSMVVGTNHLNSHGFAYGVQEIIDHSWFNPQTNVHDITLLMAYGNIEFNSKVQPIILAESILPGGSRCLLSGWGLTSHSPEIVPDDLQHISVNSISINECQRSLPGYPVSDTSVCTLNKVGEGACKGDSGSPLICGSVQHGIVSWGISCARGKPDVFTAISAYREWIRLLTGV